MRVRSGFLTYVPVRFRRVLAGLLSVTLLRRFQNLESYILGLSLDPPNPLILSFDNLHGKR